MAVGKGIDSWRGMLSTAPCGVRVMLTAFLAMIGTGYIIAVLNIYYSHQLADGKEGLSVDDIRAVYRGLSVERHADTVIPSRMLTMINGAMREYISDAQDYDVLQAWLKKGASKEGLDQRVGEKTARRVMVLDCLRCHAQSTGTEIAKKAPFGTDEFDVDYAMIAPFATAQSSSTRNTVEVPAQYTVPRLVLMTHMHILSIPMFTLVVGILFSLTRWPRGLRSWTTPLPMLGVLMDFAGWWLARISDTAIPLMVVAGMVFGSALGVQIVAVALDLWLPKNRREEAEFVV